MNKQGSFGSGDVLDLIKAIIYVILGVMIISALLSAF
jgi:hypothetical protein